MLSCLNLVEQKCRKRQKSSMRKSEVIPMDEKLLQEEGTYFFLTPFDFVFSDMLGAL